MTVLSELLHQSNVQGWSNREISVRADKNGHKLSRASVDVYMGGRHGRPTEAVLAAFSDVLNIPIDKLRTAAGVPAGTGSPWTPPSEANRLDTRQRRALEELIRSMVTSETIGEDRTDDQQDATSVARDAEPDGVTPKPDTGGIRSWGRHRPLAQDDLDLAADHGESARAPMDEAARRRGEESQDPGTDEPA